MYSSIKTWLYKDDESMWEIVGASNLIGINTLEQVKKSMAMDAPDVSVSVLFDWTQPRCTRCVVNRVRVN